MPPLARTSGFAAAALALALAATAGALGSDVASRTSAQPGIVVVAGPSLQWLDAKVVGRIDGMTHRRRPALVLGTARFTIMVRNSGAVALRGVAITDPLSPGCNRTIAALAPDASVSYRCSAPKVGRNFTNTVTASGRPAAVARSLASAGATAAARATASATTTVKVRRPKKRRSHVPRLPFTG